MAISIAVETPLQDDVRAMVAELNATMIPLTPREFQFQLTVEQMADPSLTTFVARDETGRHVGMASLKDHGGGLGEVKRMFTLPEVRGQRVGSQLLQRVEALGAREGHLPAGAGDRRGAGLRGRLPGLRARRLHGLRRGARLPGFRLFALLRKEDCFMTDLTRLTIAEARDEAARQGDSPRSN